jgi:hypothetical protein
MTKDNSPVTIYESGNLIDPTPREIHLKTIDHVRLEMAKVYREMKLQSIPTSDGTRLVYVLAQIGKLIELHDIERRLEKLEAKNEFRK